MAQQNHNIIAVHIANRTTEVSPVQKVLSSYGSIIKTRLGLHHADGVEDSPLGLLVLEVLDSPNKNLLIEDLEDIDGVEVKEIVFEH